MQQIHELTLSPKKVASLLIVGAHLSAECKLFGPT